MEKPVVCATGFWYIALVSLECVESDTPETWRGLLEFGCLNCFLVNPACNLLRFAVSLLILVNPSYYLLNIMVT